jgi:hypothetical protein
VKVAFCVPSLHGPTAPFIEALEKSIPFVTGAGWDECCVEERGCPYISSARATMLRKALDAKADAVVFLDYDLSWRPEDLLKLIATEGEVVAGLYRFKKEPVEYMGVIKTNADGTPIVRKDGCIRADRVPAGFLKITKEAVDRFMGEYPELIFGPRYNPSIDLFNHGAHEGVWWGEDYAFSRRWTACGGEIWVVPDLGLTHHGDEPFPGNFHEFMLRQPGGSEA